MASNNDCGIREYDMEKFQFMNHFRFPWPVNVSSFMNLKMLYYTSLLCEFLCLYFLLMQHTSVSPDSKLLAVVGDDLNALLVDSQNGKVICL